MCTGNETWGRGTSVAAGCGDCAYFICDISDSPTFSPLSADDPVNTLKSYFYKAAASTLLKYKILDNRLPEGHNTVHSGFQERACVVLGEGKHLTASH